MSAAEEPTPSKPPVQYVLVRRDLPPERWVIDTGHACAEAIRVAPIDKRTVLRALFVADEAELRAYADKLTAKGFHFGLVIEPDHPYNGQAMSLATEPATKRISALSKVLFHLARLRFDDAPEAGWK